MNKTVDHVECGSCGQHYDAERRWGRMLSIICGACGCEDERLVKITSTVIDDGEAADVRGRA